jgi:hypothetical protein
MTFPNITVEFSPAWWLAHYGDTAGRDRRLLLFERFGDVGLGEEAPQPAPPTVGSEYGHRFMSALWGCQIVHQADHPPAALPLRDARRRMENLEVPDLDSSPVVGRIREQARDLKQRHGACRAWMDYGGPLNNALSVFGDEILLALAAEPELAGRVLRKMGEAILAVHDRVVCAINGEDPSAARAANWWIGDCPVCMISPQTYWQAVLPVDLWFRGLSTGQFGLHHCGVFDRYAEAYKPLRPTILDLGPGSDLRLARRAYPHAAIFAWIDVGALSRMGRAEVDAFIWRAMEDAAPLAELRVADAGTELTDETVRNLLTARNRVH